MPLTQLNAFLYCPFCQQATPAQMPFDHRVATYECLFCGGIMATTPGRCCVFCSHADTPCPSCQVENTCEVRSVNERR
jgi:hypothetical protein